MYRLTSRDELGYPYPESDRASILEKLAKYEDTGYEPEEIVGLMGELVTKLRVLKVLTVTGDNRETVANICDELGKKLEGVLERVEEVRS